MTATELWIEYDLASHHNHHNHCNDHDHYNHAPTHQLIELDEKLVDAEDILAYGMYSIQLSIGNSLTEVVHVVQVFRQGYVEAKNRPFVHWQRKDGVAVKPSCIIVELLEEGVGVTPESALTLVVGEHYRCPVVWVRVSLTLP